jgi:hypothetical protein
VKVWVLWYTTGFVTGVLGCVADEGLGRALQSAGAELRRAQNIVGGGFTRVRNPEAAYRDDERVFRNGAVTLIARPFTVEVPA